MRLRPFHVPEARTALGSKCSTPLHPISFRAALYHSVQLLSRNLVYHTSHTRPNHILECDSGHPTKNGPSHSVLDRYLIIQSPLDANTRLLNSYEDRQNACFPSHSQTYSYHPAQNVVFCLFLLVYGCVNPTPLVEALMSHHALYVDFVLFDRHLLA